VSQIRFSLFDIFKNIRINILFLLQMTVVFLILSYSLNNIIALSNGLKRLEALRNTQAYVISDSTPNEKVDQLLSDSDTSVSKMQRLYGFLSSSPISQYTIWGYQNDVTVDGITIEQKTANKKFYDFYKLGIIEGREFASADFNSSKVVPILIGYNLRNKYLLGGTYKFVDGGTGQEQACKVVGVLENNASYPDIRNPMHLINLNYTYMKPFSPTNERLNAFSDLDMAINSTVVFTDRKDVLKSVESLSAGLDLFSIKFVTLQANIDAFLETFYKAITYQFVISAIILVFACVGMTSALLSMVKKNMRDYSIHIFCGGRLIDILIRISIQVVFVFALALAPTLIVFGPSSGVAITMLLALLLCCLILVPSFWALHSASISSMIRRSE